SCAASSCARCSAGWLLQWRCGSPSISSSPPAASTCCRHRAGSEPMRRALLVVVIAVLAAARATAQEIIPESIQIGLSTDRITITSDFSGADLTIFGAVDGADPQVSRQGGYDVIVVLEGPAEPIVVWKRSRILGVWVNSHSETFVNIPVSYSVSTTRVFQDITSTTSYRQLSLGAQNIYLEPKQRREKPETIAEFTAALRDRKLATGLYRERIGGVQFLSSTLF